MSKPYDPSHKIRLVADWIEQAAVCQQEVTPLQLRTWVAGLRVPVMGLDAIERGLKADTGGRVLTVGSERITALEAEQLCRDAAQMIYRLAIHAIAPEPGPSLDIEAAAHQLQDIIEHLARGVARPVLPGEVTRTPVQTPDIGA